VHLPPNIPAANFWSVTLYEAENASGLANGQPFPALGARDKPAPNADGSTELYLGPEALAGKPGTGCGQCRAKAISRFCGAIARPKRQSTSAGSRAILRRCIEE
jgi:hypothetical protein